MNKQRVKKLYSQRRDQTARLLQQTHRIGAFVASMISEPDLCNVDRMNVILATEQPSETVVEAREVAAKMAMGVGLGFPSLVLVFLYERFRDDAKIMKHFEVKLREIELEGQDRNAKGLRIIRLRGRPKDYYVKPPQTRELAVLYHLRNVLAHGQWKYDETKVNPDNMIIRVTDYKPDNNCKPGSDYL